MFDYSPMQSLHKVSLQMIGSMNYLQDSKHKLNCKCSSKMHYLHLQWNLHMNLQGMFDYSPMQSLHKVSLQMIGSMNYLQDSKHKLNCKCSSKMHYLHLQWNLHMNLQGMFDYSPMQSLHKVSLQMIGSMNYLQDSKHKLNCKCSSKMHYLHLQWNLHMNLQGMFDYSPMQSLHKVSLQMIGSMNYLQDSKHKLNCKCSSKMHYLHLQWNLHMNLQGMFDYSPMQSLHKVSLQMIGSMNYLQDSKHKLNCKCSSKMHYLHLQWNLHMNLQGMFDYSPMQSLHKVSLQMIGSMNYLQDSKHKLNCKCSSKMHYLHLQWNLHMNLQGMFDYSPMQSLHKVSLQMIGSMNYLQDSKHKLNCKCSSKMHYLHLQWNLHMNLQGMFDYSPMQSLHKVSLQMIGSMNYLQDSKHKLNCKCSSKMHYLHLQWNLHMNLQGMFDYSPMQSLHKVSLQMIGSMNYLQDSKHKLNCKCSSKMHYLHLQWNLHMNLQGMFDYSPMQSLHKVSLQMIGSMNYLQDSKHKLNCKCSSKMHYLHLQWNLHMNLQGMFDYSPMQSLHKVSLQMIGSMNYLQDSKHKLNCKCSSKMHYLHLQWNLHMNLQGMFDYSPMQSLHKVSLQMIGSMNYLQDSKHKLNCKCSSKMHYLHLQWNLHMNLQGMFDYSPMQSLHKVSLQMIGSMNYLQDSKHKLNCKCSSKMHYLHLQWNLHMNLQGMFDYSPMQSLHKVSLQMIGSMNYLQDSKHKLNCKCSSKMHYLHLQWNLHMNLQGMFDYSPMQSLHKVSLQMIGSMNYLQDSKHKLNCK